jgi:hypothetical protein
VRLPFAWSRAQPPLVDLDAFRLDAGLAQQEGERVAFWVDGLDDRDLPVLDPLRPRRARRRLERVAGVGERDDVSWTQEVVAIGCRYRGFAEVARCDPFLLGELVHEIDVAVWTVNDQRGLGRRVSAPPPVPVIDRGADRVCGCVVEFERLVLTEDRDRVDTGRPLSDRDLVVPQAGVNPGGVVGIAVTPHLPQLRSGHPRLAQHFGKEADEPDRLVLAVVPDRADSHALAVDCFGDLRPVRVSSFEASSTNTTVRPST